MFQQQIDMQWRLSLRSTAVVHDLMTSSQDRITAVDTHVINCCVLALSLSLSLSLSTAAYACNLRSRLLVHLPGIVSHKPIVS